MSGDDLISGPLEAYIEDSVGIFVRALMLYLPLALPILAVLVVYAVTFGAAGRRSDAPRSVETAGRS